MARLFGLLLFALMAWGQRPSDADAAVLIERSRETARAYVQSLREFLATQVIHRYAGGEAVNGFWSPIDVLTIQLRYFQHKEDHRLMLVDGRAPDRTFETLEGITGWGEFGTALSAVFESASQTNFHWQRWKNVRKHRAAVFGYVVNGAHTRYRLGATSDGRPLEADLSFHGVLEIDTETGQVLHLEYIADHIPDALPLQYAGTMVDYAVADIGGRQYLLPSRSVTEMRNQSDWARSVIEFRE